MEESPIFVKTDQLLMWLVRCTEKFRKSQRFKMALRIEDPAFAFQESIQAAGKSKDRQWLILPGRTGSQDQTAGRRPKSPVPCGRPPGRSLEPGVFAVAPSASRFSWLTSVRWNFLTLQDKRANA